MFTVFIRPDAARVIREETTRFPNQECAGLLLGKIAEAGNSVCVLQTTGTGPRAIHEYSSVTPDTEFLNGIIQEAERDGFIFLGEWHKHPGGYTNPSSGDRTTIESIMKDNRLTHYVAVIVTGVGSGATFTAFRFSDEISCTQVDCRVQAELMSSGDESTTAVNESPGFESIDEASDSQRVNEFPPAPEPEEEEEKKPRGVISWFARAISKNDRVSHVSKMAWFAQSDGKALLLRERNGMHERFPDFALRRRGFLFWKGEYRGHTITLQYPDDFPRKAVVIAVSPSVPPLPNETACYYATIAAEAAIARINLALSVGPAGESESASAVPWFNTSEGCLRLREEKKHLVVDRYDYHIHLLPDGRLALRVHLDDETTVLLACPMNYPSVAPQVIVDSSVLTREALEEIEAFSRANSILWDPHLDTMAGMLDEISSIVEGFSRRCSHG